MIQKSFIDRGTCRMIHSAYENLRVEGMQNMTLDTYEALEAVLTTTQSAVFHEEDWSSFCVLYMDKNGMYLNPGIFGGLPMAESLDSRVVSDMIQRSFAIFNHIEAPKLFITLSKTDDLDERVQYVEKIGFKIVDSDIRQENQYKRIFHLGMNENDLAEVYYISK